MKCHTQQLGRRGRTARPQEEPQPVNEQGKRSCHHQGLGAWGLVRATSWLTVAPLPVLRWRREEQAPLCPSHRGADHLPRGSTLMP